MHLEKIRRTLRTFYILIEIDKRNFVSSKLALSNHQDPTPSVISQCRKYVDIPSIYRRSNALAASLFNEICNSEKESIFPAG